MRHFEARTFARCALSLNLSLLALACADDNDERRPVIGAPTTPGPVIVTEGGSLNGGGSAGRLGSNDAFGGTNSLLAGATGFGLAGSTPFGAGGSGNSAFGSPMGSAGDVQFGSAGSPGFGIGGSPGFGGVGSF